MNLHIHLKSREDFWQIKVWQRSVYERIRASPPSFTPFRRLFLPVHLQLSCPQAEFCSTTHKNNLDVFTVRFSDYLVSKSHLLEIFQEEPQPQAKKIQTAAKYTICFQHFLPILCEIPIVFGLAPA